MRITVDAVVDNLDDVLGLLDEELEERGCPMRTQYEIDVAVEELFVNVCHYAYEGKTGPVTVDIEFAEKPRAVAISFIDSGMPYNPLEREDPDITLSVEQREIGGLGIFMVKKSMDELFYEYKDEQNHMTIRKYF